MASPFDVFRKNQKIMMVFLVGLSMVAFIVADSIDAENFPIFLGAIFGALGLWLLSGKEGGEGWAIAGVGALAGAPVGWYGPSLVGDNTAVQTAQGNLSYGDVDRILQRQETANRFLGNAYGLIVDRTPEAERSQVRQPPFFGFGDPGTPDGRRDGATLNFLFQKEADDLGIAISDEAVSRFLGNVFNDKLTDADLRQIRNELHIGTGELVDILREQIRAQEAAYVLSPRSGPTPQELWSEYKKLETTAEVTAVAVPTEAFVSEVAEPSTTELAAYFDQYKAVPAPSEDAPGFLVPRQFELASVEISLAEVRKSVTPPTDADVLAYYEANRSRFEFDRPATGGSKATTPVEAPRPAAAETPSGTPSGETSSGPAEAQRPAGDQPGTVPEVETPAPETPPGDSSSGSSDDASGYVFFQTEDPATSGAAAGTAAATQAGTQNDSPSPPAFPPLPAGETKPAPPQVVLDSIRNELTNQRVRDAADERLKKVREDVDRLISDATDSLMLPEDSRDEAARKKYDEDRRAAMRSVVDRMKEYARKNGLKFQNTPLLSTQELYDSDDYPIGKAVIWEANRPFTPQNATSVAQQVEMSSPDGPLNTIPAQSLLNESRYVAVKTQDTQPYVPTLQDEKVKARVVKAWKFQQARGLAEKRAQDLAKLDTGSGELADAVKSQTVTGKSGGRPLAARQVGPFTWLRRSTVPGAAFMMPDIVQTALPELPGAGERFMEAAFRDLAVGSTGVVPSDDGSAFYVVEVDRRSEEADLAKMREGFMKEEFFMFFSPYRMRMLQDNQEVQREWLQAFRAKHAVSETVANESSPAT